MSELHVAIPAYDERNHLPHTLESLARQSFTDFTVWICVNEPEGTEDNSPEIHASNASTILYLEKEASNFPFKLKIFNQLGHSTGVGWARNFLAEQIIELHPAGITICLDADTTLESNYLKEVLHAFNSYPLAVGLAAPYYHEIPQNQLMARNLLRYECYMRHYQVQLWKAGSPYSYLALGSAMAYRHRSWKSVRGIPKRRAAEDFYFLQKLRKTGDIIRWIPSTVYPASRYSERVPFGTGMLLNEANFEVQNSRFPFFSGKSFHMLKETFGLFSKLFKASIPLPIDSFLNDRLKGQTPFDRIRCNTSTPQQFIRNAHQYFDGLRTLQFLRYEHLKAPCSAAEIPVNFSSDPIEILARTRDAWVEKERSLQKAYMASWPNQDPMG